MQFVTVLALVAATVSTAFAAPATPAQSTAPVVSASTSATSVPTPVILSESTHCGLEDIFECAAELEPTAITCVLAAIQEGLDPVSDLPCLGLLVADVADAPDACKACF